MKRLNQIILIGALLGCSWLSASECVAEPDLKSMANRLSVPTNDQPAISITNTKSPLIIRGLYANRTKSGGKSNARAPADAVIRGLRWLQQSQNKDGSWGAGTDDLDATTGIALLAFLGHGETPASPEFGKTVELGMKYLIASMMSTNSPVLNGQPPAFGHAISTWALCEGFCMTRILALQPAVEKGLAVIQKGQKQSGLWDGNFSPDRGNDDPDVSVLQVIALKSGIMEGSHEGLRETLSKASGAMKTALEAKPDTGTLAGAVFCLQLCGEGLSPACRTALNDLATMTPDWEIPVYNDPILKWYLATQAFFYNGGEHWKRWNRLILPQLLEHQVVSQDDQGKNIGYWDSPSGGEHFGRVYTTALSLLMLEYRRILPTFKHSPLQSETNVPADEIIIDVK